MGKRAAGYYHRVMNALMSTGAESDITFLQADCSISFPPFSTFVLSLVAGHMLPKFSLAVRQLCSQYLEDTIHSQIWNQPALRTV